MLTLQIRIDDSGRAFFYAEQPVEAGGEPKPMRTTELLRTVRRVVWYPDGFTDAGGGRLEPTLANLCMFLSDVRGKRFKAGVFLDDGVFEVTSLFRAAANCAYRGRVVPGLERRDGAWVAVWLALEPSPDAAAGRKMFFRRIVDFLMRSAGRTPGELEEKAYYTPEDAWLAALRNDTGAIKWNSQTELGQLALRLRNWYEPLGVDPAERQALKLRLLAPEKIPDTQLASDEGWFLTLDHPPRTRAGCVSLGQAVAFFPPLRRLSRGKLALSAVEAESFLRTGSRALSAAGYSVEVPEGVLGEHIGAEAEIFSGDEAPDGTVSSEAMENIRAKLVIKVDGETVNAEEVRFLLDQGGTVVFFRDRWIEVDRNILREALKALEAEEATKLTLREAVTYSLGLSREGHLRIEKVKAHGWLRGMLNELKGEDAFRILPQPKELVGKLRDYQLRGASWLAFLSKWGFGPCLADDMGLGKTIQTIAFLLQMHRFPALVVAPVTVTANWVRELKRFAPSLKVMLHQGADRATGYSLRAEVMRHDVVVTSYSLLVRDFQHLRYIDFNVMILDEAQTVKNPLTRVSMSARSISSPIKVALTGTPIENSALDLWSIEEFLNPGLLGEKCDFVDDFVKPMKENASSGAAVRLRHIVAPFLLRRLKSDPGIASELGEKREVREYCPLSRVQRGLYEQALADFRAKVDDVSATAEITRRGRILALITRLKEICDAPVLVTSAMDASAGKGYGADDFASGKIARLTDLLEQIFDGGESALLFTQYAKMGEHLRAYLQEHFGRRFPFLHGSLSPKQREEEIAKFNGDTMPNVFILSLKAGGFGLNLTRATHVIHFDRWWNPAVENQATDRAHRIGQEHAVLVHTFIAPGTIEDHVDELLETKRLIAGEIVVNGESFLAKMSDRELDRIVDLDDPAESAADAEDDDV